MDPRAAFDPSVVETGRSGLGATNVPPQTASTQTEPSAETETGAMYGMPDAKLQFLHDKMDEEIDNTVAGAQERKRLKSLNFPKKKAAIFAQREEQKRIQAIQWMAQHRSAEMSAPTPSQLATPPAVTGPYGEPPSQ